MYDLLRALDFTDGQTARLAKDWDDSIAPKTIEHPPLYHYTSPEGLLGIIQSGELWASAVKYSNDLSEVENAKAQLPEHLAKLNLDNFPGLRHALDFVREYFRGDEQPPQDAYIFCFCTNGDLLSQWRGYAGAGGFSIGFANLLVSDARVYENRPFVAFKFIGRAALRPVLYKEEDQSTRLGEILSHAAEFQARALRKDVPQDKVDIFLKWGLLSQLMEWVHTVKDKAFIEEGEWRIVVFPLPKNFAVQSGLQPTQVDFRVRGAAIVPFIRLTPYSSAVLPIRRVVCGPNARGKLTQEAVMRALKLRYDGVAVDESLVPLRL